MHARRRKTATSTMSAATTYHTFFEMLGSSFSDYKGRAIPGRGS
jgi:hypothetical protein